MPKLSDAAMRKKRNRLLEAASRCFRKRGFQATTINDICSEAGISAGSVYTHFRSKHEIVAALGDEANAQRAGALERLLSTDAPAALLTELRRLFETPAGRADAELDLNLWAESVSDDALREACLQSFDAFEHALREAFAATPAAEGLAQILLAASLGFEVQRALGQPRDLDRIEDSLNAITRSRP